jgi:hypothetical protein
LGYWSTASTLCLDLDQAGALIAREGAERLTVFLGIEVPSSDALFLGIVFGVHIPLGITCVIAGATAMLSRKGRGRHATAGKLYFWCLAALFASTAILSLMRWEADYPLFLFGLAAFACALFGRTALRLRWPYWTRLHIAGMGLSYALMLAAFYLDNGKQLPIWKDLPSMLYWLLPIAIAVLLIGRALLSHPLRGLGDPQVRRKTAP